MELDQTYQNDTEKWESERKKRREGQNARAELASLRQRTRRLKARLAALIKEAQEVIDDEIWDGL